MLFLFDVGFVCFLFKQKTAYEVRISGWSSDVCSSDLIDDALKGQIVGRLMDDAQIRQSIADFRPLVKAKTADDLVGQANLNEAVFKLTRLELGEHEDRGIVESTAPALVTFYLFHDAACFLRSVPDTQNLPLFAFSIVLPQRFTHPPPIYHNTSVDRKSDVAGYG